MRWPDVAPATASQAGDFIDDSPALGTVPLVRAVRIALAHAMRERDGALATMIHPVATRLSWQRLPDWARVRFYELCTDLGADTVLTERVREALFRNTRDVIAAKRK
jgi:hypothetical protein